MTTYMHDRRLDAAMAALRACKARSVLDLGCGDGALLARLAREPGIERAVGIDVAPAALEQARRRLAATPPREGVRIDLMNASAIEPPDNLTGFDAAVLLETIEHIAPERLSALERAVFVTLAPAMVLVTTPNADFNALLGVPAHRLRHADHRFEWGRRKFQAWADGAARRNGYTVRFEDVPAPHRAYGGASQMAVFRAGGAGPRA